MKSSSKILAGKVTDCHFNNDKINNILTNIHNPISTFLLSSSAKLNSIVWEVFFDSTLWFGELFIFSQGKYLFV